MLDNISNPVAFATAPVDVEAEPDAVAVISERNNDAAKPPTRALKERKSSEKSELSCAGMFDLQFTSFQYR